MRRRLCRIPALSASMAHLDGLVCDAHHRGAWPTSHEGAISGLQVISATGQNTYPRSAFFLSVSGLYPATVIRVTTSDLVDRLLGNVRYLREPATLNVSRMILANCDQSGSAVAKLHFCLLRQLQGVLHLDADIGRCSRAWCGPIEAARRAGSWSADRSKTAWSGGWNGYRKRRDQDRFPRPRNPQSEHIAGCSNGATHEHGLGRESFQTRDLTA
jgi:hypothetical protein